MGKKATLVSSLLVLLNLPVTPVSAEPSRSVTDALSIVRRSDGDYDVVCRSGKHEIVSESDLAQGRVCLPATPPAPPPTATIDDPFDTRYCDEPTVTHNQALDKLQLPGGLSKKIGDLNVAVRARICLTADGCTAWNDVPAYTGMQAEWLTQPIVRSAGNDNQDGYGPLDQYAKKYSWWSSFSHGASPSQIGVELEHDQPQFRVLFFGSLNGYFPYAGTTWSTVPVQTARVVTDYDRDQSNVSLGLYGFANPDASCVANGYDWNRAELHFYEDQSASYPHYQEYFVPVACGDKVFKELAFNGRIGNHCAVWRSTNFFPKSFGTNTGHIEQETVVYSRY